MNHAGSAIGQTQAASQSETTRQPHIERELNDLEFTSNRLEESLNRLATRLQPVLHYSALNDGAKTPPDEVIAPLADRIRATRKRLEAYECALNTLISSIEI